MTLFYGWIMRSVKLKWKRRRNELLVKKEIFSNVFVIVLTAIFILCANFAYYDMTNLKMN